MLETDVTAQQETPPLEPINLRDTEQFPPIQTGSMAQNTNANPHEVRQLDVIDTLVLIC